MTKALLVLAGKKQCMLAEQHLETETTEIYRAYTFNGAVKHLKDVDIVYLDFQIKKSRCSEPSVQSAMKLVVQAAQAHCKVVLVGRIGEHARVGTLDNGAYGICRGYTSISQDLFFPEKTEAALNALGVSTFPLPPELSEPRFQWHYASALAEKSYSALSSLTTWAQKHLPPAQLRQSG